MEIPHNILNHRRELCRTCPEPCEFQNNDPYRLVCSNACPSLRWNVYRRLTKLQLKGMGDVVALIAEPIAGAMDAILKTKVRQCGACAKRKEMLNQMMPFGK